MSGHSATSATSSTGRGPLLAGHKSRSLESQDRGIPDSLPKFQLSPQFGLVFTGINAAAPKIGCNLEIVVFDSPPDCRLHSYKVVGREKTGKES